jgi:molybdopterin-guanine dinucleotide biosynthesis protein A
MEQTRIYGLVLAGGRSSRMGSDKGLIQYHEKSQREFLFDSLAKHCDKVFTSSSAEQGVPAQLNPLCDEYDIKGPMNGILSAFKKFPDQAWLIVAVDMPFVDEHVLCQLILNRNTSKVATCFYNEEQKFPEPLLTLWEPKALPLLLKSFQEGQVSPKHFLARQDVQLVKPRDQKMFINLNSPCDVAEYRNNTKQD